MDHARLGLLKTTFVDYPGEVAATVFTAGCNLRCPFCHNPELVASRQPEDFLSTADILAFLERRKSVLGGICITGGEPLIQPWLPEFVAAVHSLGLKVKLDTNGLYPERIEAVHAEYIAMDIKTAPQRYSLLSAGVESVPRPVSSAGPRTTESATHEIVERLTESVTIIRRAAPAYEFRTTVVDPIVTESDIRAIARLLEPGDTYTITAFRPGRTLDPAYAARPAPEATLLERYMEIARESGAHVRLRDHRISP